jgi:hypothetical protein
VEHSTSAGSPPLSISVAIWSTTHADSSRDDGKRSTPGMAPRACRRVGDTASVSSGERAFQARQAKSISRGWNGGCAPGAACGPAPTAPRLPRRSAPQEPWEGSADRNRWARGARKRLRHSNQTGAKNALVHEHGVVEGKILRTLQGLEEERGIRLSRRRLPSRKSRGTSRSAPELRRSAASCGSRGPARAGRVALLVGESVVEDQANSSST